MENTECVILDLSDILSEPELSASDLEVLGELAAGQSMQLGDLSRLISCDLRGKTFFCGIGAVRM